jgi:hypothetical protein
MNSIHVRTIVNSETITLPELRDWLGKAVEIIVLEQPSEADNLPMQYPLRGSILRDDDPFGPAVPDSEWEALR